MDDDVRYGWSAVGIENNNAECVACVDKDAGHMWPRSLREQMDGASQRYCYRCIKCRNMECTHCGMR